MRCKIYIRGVFLLLFIMLLSTSAFAAYVPNQVIVKYKQPVHREVNGQLQLKKINIPLTSRSIQEKIGAKIIEKFDGYLENLDSRDRRLNPDAPLELPEQFQNLYKIEIGTSVEEALFLLEQDPLVEYAEPNHYVRIFDTTPNDPKYSNQWGPEKISAPSAWDVTQGSSSIYIAVIDTGVNYNHEDLSSKMLSGYDFVQEDNDPDDDHGHGSQCAGIIAAETNNSVGIAGLAWNSKILPVKVLYSTGTGEVYDVAQGIQYAADRSHVLNLSLGDYENTTTMANAVSYAVNQDRVVVGAAGNDGLTDRVYPAGYDDAIAVAATDQNDERSVWNTSQSSNYGSWITVAAPGSSIYSTKLNNSYTSSNGTSFAAPHVAGVAALILAENPTWTYTQVIEQISSTADNIDSVNIGYSGLLGGGRLNAASAVGSPLASISSPSANETLSGDVQIVGSAAGEGFQYFKVEVGSGESPPTWTQIGTNHTSQVTADVLETWSTSPGENGTYTLKLTVVASEENTYSVTVNVQNVLALVEAARAGPNPFDPSQQNYTIHFNLSIPATITTYIYDTTGKLVWQNTAAHAYGVNQITWNGRNRYGTYVGNGVYLYRVATTDHTLLGSGKILVYR